MSYQESNFQSDYNKWKINNYKVTCVEELKITKSKSFRLSSIELHQLINLYNAKHNCIQHKIPDLGSQNPFDSFSICGEPAWVVVLFYKPRQPKKFYMIDIDTIQGLIDDDKKSITEEEAALLCSKQGTLNH